MLRFGGGVTNMITPTQYNLYIHIIRNEIALIFLFLLTLELLLLGCEIIFVKAQCILIAQFLECYILTSIFDSQLVTYELQPRQLSFIYAEFIYAN